MYLYSFFSDASVFPFQSRFPRRFRLLRSLTPIQIFWPGFGIFSVCHSVYHEEFHSTDCISRRRLRYSVDFSVYFCLRFAGPAPCSFRSETQSVPKYVFGELLSHFFTGVFGSAYCSLYFRLESPF